jgi:predicted RND superfamily exporter protein
MAAPTANIEAMPVVRDLKDFDLSSGNRLERLIFNNRNAVMLICLVVTILLGFMAARVSLNASYEKMLPIGHPYIQNYAANKGQLRGLGNTLRVVVENAQGDIFDPAYLDTLKKVNDDLFLTPGVDRAWVKSIWMPVVRYTEVTEEGFSGGPVMPDTYDGSKQSVEQLRQNIMKAGLVGNLVANDFKSAMIIVPLLDVDPATGERIDYWALSRAVEQNVRDKYETADGKYKVRVIGFAKIIGSLLDGILQVMLYFGAAILIAAAILFYFTRCVRSTGVVLLCSLIAVIWQIGLLRILGLGLDPFSVLVPFLIFAIGVSHGAQKMNGIQQDVGRGTVTLVAARYTFRRLFVAGVTALLNGAAGFLVLLLIPIPAIRELAIAATIGVCVLLFTNLVLLPVILSITGVSKKAAARSLKQEEQGVLQSFCGSQELGCRRGDRGDCARARRPSRLTEAADRRSRSRCSRTARELALQRRQRLHHGEFLALLRRVRGDHQDAGGAVHAVCDAAASRPAGVAPAAVAGGAGDGVAGRLGQAGHRRHV